jgi:hypothetical protein
MGYVIIKKNKTENHIKKQWSGYVGVRIVKELLILTRYKPVFLRIKIICLANSQIKCTNKYGLFAGNKRSKNKQKKY